MSLVRIDAQIRCPFCHDSILTGPRTGCAECLAWHHTACLEEHGSCSNCGAPPSLGSRQTTRQDVSEVLAQICQTPGCYSLETLERPGRKICARHARDQLAGVTVGGVLSLIFGVGLGLSMIGIYHSQKQGPWPLLTIPVVFMIGFGVFAIYRHSGEKASIEAALAKRDAPESSPPLEVRARVEKVSS